MTYVVEGVFRMGRLWQNFKINVEASNKESAERFALIKLGSLHKVKSRFIKISKVSEVNGKQKP